MLQAPQNPLIPGLIAVVVSMILTYGVRWFAHKYGYVAHPKSDRWHTRTTAMLGGVGIFLATLIVAALFVPFSFEASVVTIASIFLFFVGLLDDLLNIKPYQKLIGQLIGATIVVGFGINLPITGYELIDIWITIFWLIGITNAINLLDNMDGLAAGITSIGAIFLAVAFYMGGDISDSMLVATFIGALLGFLVFNFNPASIFMGDCGSMFIGFFLASSVLLGESGGRSRSLFTILAVPVLILFVPIFDTTLVTVMRKLWGRRASQGGRDHTSHRLVALGMSERSAVLMIYAFAVAAGFVSMLVARLELSRSLAIIALFTLALGIFGIYLAKVKVYDEDEAELATENNAAFAFLVNFSHKRRLVEVFLDAGLITLAYYLAYILTLGPIQENANWSLFLATVPLLIVIKLFAFLAAGVYRGIWRYTSVGDLITFAKGVLLGSVMSAMAMLFINRFANLSRAVFIIDFIVLLFLILASRLGFRVIRELLPTAHISEGRRVLIYGAGDGGEMVLRELRNNAEWNYAPVGFIDDDPLKDGKMINGLRVMHSNGKLDAICDEHNVQEILVSSSKIPPDKIRALRAWCNDENIELKRAALRIEPLGFD